STPNFFASNFSTTASGSWRSDPSSRPAGARTSVLSHSVSATRSPSTASGSHVVGRKAAAVSGPRVGGEPSLRAQHELAEFAHRAAPAGGLRHVMRRGLHRIDRARHGDGEPAALHHLEIGKVVAHERAG